MSAAGDGMRLGLCLAVFGGAGLAAALAEVADYGPLCLDLPTDTTLGLVDARRCFAEAGYRDEVAAVLAGPAARGQPVSCVSNSRDAQLLLGPHGPHTDPVCPGSAEEKRDHAVRCAIGAIRLAERTRTPVVRLLVGCPDFARWLSWWGSDVSWADNVDTFYTQAEPVLRAAREAGVVVTLEPHPKQIVYDRASAELLFAAGPQWAGTLALCVDPANLAAMGHDPVEAVRGWRSRLAAVHAKDLQTWTGSGGPSGRGWSRYGPGPPVRFRALGLGVLDWPAIVSTLIDEGFENVLYVEHEDVLLPRRQGIARSLGLLREFLPGGAAEGRTW
ncbi:MAG TPA: sugar phosphate isomerase/epimerase family protein [Streptosporangiaceae bacterium]